MKQSEQRIARDVFEAAVTAISRSLATIRAAHPGEHLHGYAILTDDDLRTAFYAAVTKEHLADHPQLHVRVNPVDWPVEGYQEFHETCRALVASAEAAHGAGWGAHVDQCFRALVAALHQVARQQAQVDPDVRLVVGSTDPGERLERLEDESMRELNSSEVYWQWRAEIDEGVRQSRS